MSASSGMGSVAGAVAGLDAPQVVAARPAQSLLRRSLETVLDHLVLTKWRITLIAMVTAYAAVAVHGTYATDWAHLWPLALALFATGGAANVLNQVFEMGRDGVMRRTRVRRPLPDGRMTKAYAMGFAVVLFLLGEAIFVLFYNSWLAAGLGLFTLLFYSFLYTLWLKPRHYLNIVIGGVPGAMGPLLAWAALADEIALAPLALFSVIFLWTPPHVWALAIRLKDDYARAGIPMLPVVKGVDETTKQIFLYTLVLVIATFALPFAIEACQRSSVYVTLAIGLGAIFLAWTLILWLRRPMWPTMPLFHFTNLYLTALFIGVMIDALMTRGTR